MGPRGQAEELPVEHRQKAVVRSKGNKAPAGGSYEYAGGRAQRKRHHDTAAYACADTTSQRR